MKAHYGKHHTRKELVDGKVPLEPIIRYTKKALTKMVDGDLLAKEYENEKREAFFLLDDNTRIVMLELQFQLPIIKMFAIEGAE